MCGKTGAPANLSNNCAALLCGLKIRVTPNKRHGFLSETYPKSETRCRNNQINITMTRRKTRITSIGCQEPTCSTSPGPELQTWTEDHQTFKHQVRLFHGVQKGFNELLYQMLPKRHLQQQIKFFSSPRRLKRSWDRKYCPFHPK